MAATNALFLTVIGFPMAMSLTRMEDRCCMLRYTVGLGSSAPKFRKVACSCISHVAQVLYIAVHKYMWMDSKKGSRIGDQTQIVM